MILMGGHRPLRGLRFVRACGYAARRPGDIMTMVADTSCIRSLLDWTPHYDDLETFASHALAWEEKLSRERGEPVRQAESA